MRERRRHMKVTRSVAAAFLAAGVILSGAATRARAYRHSSEWTGSFETSGPAHLEIVNTRGQVEVSGWGGDFIKVRAVVRIKAPSRSEAEDIRRRIEFDTGFDGDSLRIRALIPRIRMAGISGEAATAVSVRYSVAVPTRTGLDIETAFGGITVAGVEGDFALDTGDGPVRVESRGGEGTIEASDGDVSCVLLSFPERGRLEIAASGTVRLGIPPGTGAELDAEASRGAVEVGPGMSGMTGPERGPAGGVVGEGAGRIRISSSGGDIFVGAVRRRGAVAGPPAADR